MDSNLTTADFLALENRGFGRGYDGCGYRRHGAATTGIGLAAGLGGGALLLALAGLGWRCWVRNLMVLALCVLLFQGIWYGLQVLGERPQVRGRWPEIVLGLAGGAALVGLALFLLLFVFFLRDYDRVSEWEGQTVVAEYRGIDRGSHQCPRVCRYESWLLRGEELGPGR